MLECCNCPYHCEFDWETQENVDDHPYCIGDLAPCEYLEEESEED